MIEKRLITKIFSFVIVVLIMIFGLANLSVSLIPYDSVKSFLDLLAGKRVERLFNPDQFLSISTKCKYIGVVSLLIGTILLIKIQLLINFISILGKEFVPSKKGILNLFKKLREEDKKCFSTLLLLILISVILRLYFLFQPMRYDESFTFLIYASRPLYIALSDYSFPNNHLFHTFLVHLVYNIFGNEPWLIRFPAFLAGILIVPSTYILFKKLHNRHSAILATCLVSTSSALIEYSTNARGYTIVTLLSLWLVVIGINLLRTNKIRGWTAFVILGSLGFYTISIMLYPFGMICMWLIASLFLGKIKVKKKRFIKNFIISVICLVFLTAILYFPAFIISDIITSIKKYAKTTTYYDLFENFPSFLASLWNLWNKYIPKILRYILACGFLVAILFYKKTKGKGAPIAPYGLIWCIILIICTRVLPFVRVLLFFLPFYLGFSSIGLIFIFTKIKNNFHNRFTYFLSIIIFTIFLGTIVVISQSPNQSDYTGSFQEAEEITLLLKNRLKKGDKVAAICPSNYPLHYYFKYHNVPTNYLHHPKNSEKNIYVVVNLKRQSLFKVLKECKLSRKDAEHIKFFKQVGNGTVYIIIRKKK